MLYLNICEKCSTCVSLKIDFQLSDLGLFKVFLIKRVTKMEHKTRFYDKISVNATETLNKLRHADGRKFYLKHKFLVDPRYLWMPGRLYRMKTFIVICSLLKLERKKNDKSEESYKIWSRFDGENKLFVG